ncbi:MAG: helix-turn-helix transcriptional regulator [Lachnospiraceae bacterium]|nr:helix-turn-helix transcriptional regulator [Lachnospiraceae bacterium]
MISFTPLFKTMKEKNISSYKLEKLGFSRATYYSIQQGNSISTNTVNQLCKLLKCEVSDIMEFVDEDEKKEQKTE